MKHTTDVFKIWQQPCCKNYVKLMSEAAFYDRRRNLRVYKQIRSEAVPSVSSSPRLLQKDEVPC